MSEAQTRPAAPRGRGSSRGARGGYGARGGARGGRPHTTNGDKPGVPSASFEEEGEMGELKRKYASQLSTLRELFPDWTDEDLAYALQETDGDLEATIERITEGSVSQWGEVKKKTKDRSRSKANEPVPTSATDSIAPTRGRGARGSRAGGEGGRGGRSRGADRGRGGVRGGRGGSAVPTNGSRVPKELAESTLDFAKTSVPTEGSSAWDTSASNPQGDAAGATQSWADTTSDSVNTAAVPDAPKSSVISGEKKSWASMFAKPTPPPAVKKPPQQPALEQISSQSLDAQRSQSGVLPPPAADSSLETTPSMASVPSEPEPNITPSADELTETNLEQVLDASAPPASATAASTVASSKDPRSAAGSGTPYSSGNQLSASSRPQLSGYATTAYKAAAAPGRTSSFQRRVLDQQEAVVMPGKHAVDRTAVQFGSMGLNGSSDPDQDVDEDREEAETRAQPPQHSPVAQPRASLPPAPHGQGLPSQPAPATSDAQPTPKQAPGLPALPQQPGSMTSAQSSIQPPLGPQSMAHQGSQGSHQYGQFNRYGQQPAQQEQSSSTQKPYDPFGQQAPHPQSHQSQYDPYSGQGQAQEGHDQGQQQPQQGGFSSAPTDYSSYYTSDQQQRGGYGGYYGSQYGQQGAQSQQDAGAAQQRSGSGYGHAAADSASQYPGNQAQQGQSRYGQAGDTQGSGQTTPSIPAHQGHQGSQPQHMQQHQPQGQGYPYNHPYYQSPYYSSYMNQYGYGQGYGGPYGGKGNMYGQPHQGYGISPQSSYEHSSSPANIGGFNQPSLHSRDSGLSGSLHDYGRSGSAQQSQGQQQSGGANSGFGGMSDVFGRAGLPSQGQGQGSGQSQPLGQYQSGSQAGMDDSLKAFADTKSTSGPSPSVNQPNRPGSTSNTAAGGQGYPQSQQGGGFGGYPSHLNHHLQGGQAAGSGQYGGGLGGLGGHQASGDARASGAQGHQASGGGGGGYGNYGSGFGGSYYGGSSGGRGGWGGNYSGH